MQFVAALPRNPLGHRHQGLPHSAPAAFLPRDPPVDASAGFCLSSANPPRGGGLGSGQNPFPPGVCLIPPAFNTRGMYQIHPTNIPSIPVLQQRLVREGVSQRRLSTPPPSGPPEAGPPLRKALALTPRRRSRSSSATSSSSSGRSPSASRRARPWPRTSDRASKVTKDSHSVGWVYIFPLMSRLPGSHPRLRFAARQPTRTHGFKALDHLLEWILARKGSKASPSSLPIDRNVSPHQTAPVRGSRNRLVSPRSRYFHRIHF